MNEDGIPPQPPRTQRPHKSAVRLWIDSATALSKPGFKAMYEGVWDMAMYEHGMANIPMGVGKTSALLAAEQERAQRIRLQGLRAELRAQMRDIIRRVVDRQLRKDSITPEAALKWPLLIDSLSSLPDYSV